MLIEFYFFFNLLFGNYFRFIGKLQGSRLTFYHFCFLQLTLARPLSRPPSLSALVLNCKRFYPHLLMPGDNFVVTHRPGMGTIGI